jgi:hypothetical protein
MSPERYELGSYIPEEGILHSHRRESLKYYGGKILPQPLTSGPPLWSSAQTSWLLPQRSRVRFPALPDFLSSSVSGTGSTQPL